MSPESGEAPWRYSVSTFRTPHFPALWTSNLLHFTGWSAQAVILQWLVTSLTDSRTIIGLVLFVQGAVVLLASPIAGVAVDRLPRRSILVIGRFALALLLFSIAFAVARDWITIWQLLIAVGIASLITALMNPATQTYVLDVVPPDRAQSAVSLNAAGSVLGQTGGPLAGAALLAAFGFTGAYSSTGGLLVIAAIGLLAVGVRGGNTTREDPAPWWSDFREVLVYVVRHPGLRLVFLACAMSVFNGAIAVMRPVFARHVLEVGSTGYGALAAASGAGGLIAAVVLAARPPLARTGPVIVGSMLAFAVAILLYAFAFSYAWCLALELFAGFAAQLWMVSTYSGVQMAVPERMRGRVMGLVFMLVTGAQLGALLIGLLADAIGDQLAMGVFGLIPTIALTVLLVRGRRELRAL
jgi:MFS family permease